jgi:hypothetical protein
VTTRLCRRPPFEHERPAGESARNQVRGAVEALPPIPQAGLKDDGQPGQPQMREGVPKPPKKRGLHPRAESALPLN